MVGSVIRTFLLILLICQFDISVDIVGSVNWTVSVDIMGFGICTFPLTLLLDLSFGHSIVESVIGRFLWILLIRHLGISVDIVDLPFGHCCRYCWTCHSDSFR
jgi:hypothetical protein